MNQPSPVLVSQEAVRRLPRWGLLLFCAIYVIAGFIGRDPWKRMDVTSYGYMLDLAHNPAAQWLHPALLGEPATSSALLPYWLGAWAIRLTPPGLDSFLGVRLVFMAVLALTLAAVWYGIYYLARHPQAQPVAFAFGGEARPTDYARAVADGGLLALLACLGLAQAAHEVAPPLVQLCAVALMLYALAALPYRQWAPALWGSAGALGLTLSGAPTLAILLVLWGLLVHALRGADWLAAIQSRPSAYAIFPAELQQQQRQAQRRHRQVLWGMAGLALVCSACAGVLNLWGWQVEPLPQRWVQWRNLLRMWLWMLWPAWLLALWTLWRWRQYWQRGMPAAHIALPLGLLLLCAVIAAFSQRHIEQPLLLTLPAVAALAAFALPTLRRSAAALVDWFSVIFFSLAAGYLWFMWVALQTGVPSSPARLALRRVPGYVVEWHWLGIAAAVAATAGWLILVRWRTSRLPPAIWKSVILPAGGVTLCWTLICSLWLVPLNHVRSYNPMTQATLALLADNPTAARQCVLVHGLAHSQIAALQHASHMQLGLVRQQPADLPPCQWLLAAQHAAATLSGDTVDMRQWQLRGVAQRPTDPQEAIGIYARITATPPDMPAP